jgi:biotin operon repressor
MSDWTLAAYNRADALYSEIGSDQDRLVLMLAKEIAGWEGVRHYDAHRLADKATKHAIAQAKAPTPKGTTPRGTTPRGMHPAHGAMYWKVVAWLRTTDPKKVSRLDEAVLHALLAHYNGKSGQCNPGSKTLAAEVRATRTTVLKSVKRLETCGAISIDDHDHDGRSFAYSFKLG